MNRSKRGRELSTLRKRIVWHLRHEWRFSEGGSSWSGFAALANDLGAPIRDVRREVRKMSRFVKDPPVYYTTLFNEDCEIQGSGYLLCDSWEEHIPGRFEDPPPEEFAPIIPNHHLPLKVKYVR